MMEIISMTVRALIREALEKRRKVGKKDMEGVKV